MEEILYEKLISWENLFAAWKQASKGKRGRCATAAFEFNLEEQLLTLQDELKYKTYKPGAYSSFYIHEPKRRLISAAPFRDRVVHHALCRIIEPVFERSFVFDSYANRIGKGTHRALDRAQYFARKYRYVLPCDIEQFFPAIDHDILKTILRKKISDSDILWLLDSILKSGVDILSDVYEMQYFPGDDLLAPLRPRGLPIGNLTSQFWANCYLSPFDHFIKRELECPAYVRYVDDFMIFADDKQLLWKCKQRIMERLQTFRLTLHEKQTQVRPTITGVSFLGFIVFPSHRRLKNRKGFYFRRAMKQRLASFYTGELTFEQIKASILGWINHVSYGDTRGLRRSMLNEFKICFAERAL